MLADLVAGEIGGVLLVFARLGAALMIVPGFGEHYVLPRLRLLLALALSLLVAPALAGRLPAAARGAAGAGGTGGARDPARACSWASPPGWRWSRSMSAAR